MEGTEQKILIMLLMVVLIIGTFPLIQNAIINLDTSLWTFDGASSVILFLSAIPYLYLLIGCLVPVYFIMELRE